MKHEARAHHYRSTPIPVEGVDSPLGRIRRRSARATLSVPVVVYGRFDNRVFFREKAATLKVSKHGCLLAVNTELRAGEELVLRRGSTNEEQSCRVVYLGRSNRQAGLEFTGELKDFWHIYFPPVNARAALADPDFVQL